MKQMKFYGTLGPACHDQKLLADMLLAGMTGMRLNLSHGMLADRADWIANYRAAQAQTGICADFLVDLRGPELRIGKIGIPQNLCRGDRVLLINDSLNQRDVDKSKLNRSDADQESLRIPVPANVLQALRPDSHILLNDGKVELIADQAVSIEEALSLTILCTVLREGEISDGKSIALPGIRIEAPTITESDRENLRHARGFGVNQVMLPFVRSRQDVENLRQELKELELEDIQIFAKIENMEGVESLEEIIPVADHIVIARGDLGNALPLWELPRLQKQIAEICRSRNKDFMVVTQMLDSMTNSPVPTRAEVSDIYNAVLDGAASLMVTGETAAGKYPLETVKYLVRTARMAE